MRKHSIISVLLAFCLCFVMAVPALALDVTSNNQYTIGQDVQSNAEVEIDNMSIINNVNFEQAEIDSLEISDDVAAVSMSGLTDEQNAKATHYEATFDKGTVDVYTTINGVSKTDVEDFVNTANNAIKQEMAIIAAKNETVPDVILYQYTDGNIQIACSADANKSRGYAANDFYVTQLSIFENAALAQNAEPFNSMISPQQNPAGFETGIGIRHIANQDGQYMTATIANCPPLNVEKTVNGVANSSYAYYHYIGFSGTYKGQELGTDMGLLYSNKYKGWQPYMKVNQMGKRYMLWSDVPGITVVGCVEDQLGLAAYGMTSPITITAYKTIPGYNNGNNNGESKIRLTVKGTRISPLTQNVMCISEAGTGADVTVKWKALTTIAGSPNIPAGSNSMAPRIEMNYSNVKIGTKNATWNNDDYDFTLIRSRITSQGSGYIKGKVNFS